MEPGSDRKERPEDPDSRFNKRRKGFSLICVFCDREKNRRAGLISSGPHLFKPRLGDLGSSCQCITSRFCFRNPKRKGKQQHHSAAANSCCRREASISLEKESEEQGHQYLVATAKQKKTQARFSVK